MHGEALHVEGTDAFGTAINIDNTTTIASSPTRSGRWPARLRVAGPNRMLAA
jgi:hypothetical protein